MVTAPTLIFIYDYKMRTIGTAVVNYDEVEARLNEIAELCEKNQWTIRTLVPAAWPVFVSELERKGK